MRRTITSVPMTAHLLRPMNLEDTGELRQLVNDIYRFDGVKEALAPEEMPGFITGPHFEPKEDSRVAVAGGRLVGYAKVHCRPSEEREAWAFLEGGVHADHRSQGIGASLFDWQMGRARARLSAAPDNLARHIRTDLHPTQTIKEAMVLRRGFETVRYYEDMIRPLRNDPAPAPVGFRIVPWDHARADEVRDVKNAAFRDHWGSIPVDRATWEHWLSESTTRLDLSFVALDQETVVGYCLVSRFPQDDEIHGRREGWIDSLGTLRAWRGRGVATALMQHAFVAFEQAGLSHAALGVDSENPTGARGLYERIGFVSVHSMKIAQISVTDRRRAGGPAREVSVGSA